MHASRACKRNPLAMWQRLTSPWYSGIETSWMALSWPNWSLHNGWGHLLRHVTILPITHWQRTHEELQKERPGLAEVSLVDSTQRLKQSGTSTILKRKGVVLQISLQMVESKQRDTHLHTYPTGFSYLFTATSTVSWWFIQHWFHSQLSLSCLATI